MYYNFATILVNNNYRLSLSLSLLDVSILSSLAVKLILLCLSVCLCFSVGYVAVKLILLPSYVHEPNFSEQYWSKESAQCCYRGGTVSLPTSEQCWSSNGNQRMSIEHVEMNRP